MSSLRSLYLYKNPVVAAISGLFSSFFLWIQHILTDQLLLKEAAGLGVWTAAFVGVISLFIYMVKLYDIVTSRFKKWRNNRYEKLQ